MRALIRLLPTVLALLVIAGVAYAFSDAFGKRWIGLVEEHLRERGIHAQVKHLSLSILDGVVAREITVFQDPEHTRLIMTMDSLSLDLDYEKLVRREFPIEGIDLTEANVSMPLGGKDKSTLDLRNLAARIFVSDQRIEISRAQGELAGLRVLITGSFAVPASTPEGGTEQGSAVKKPTAMELPADLGPRVQRGLQWLKRFKHREAPLLTLEVSGTIGDPSSLQATAQIRGHDIEHEGYVCTELIGSADYRNRVVEVRRLFLRDKLGTFEAAGTWPLEGDAIRFNVQSSADLPKLARTFFANNELREVVFYEPPQVDLSGTWFIRGPQAGPRRPVEALGTLRFGRFTSRGEVFDGLSAVFGVQPQGYYLRDALLRHKTGTLSLQAMARDVEGFRYRAVLRMDPRVFLPFGANEVARLWVERFEFQDHSSVLVELDGNGTDANFAACRHRGRLELRQFKYRGVEFASWAADVELFNRKQAFRNIEVLPMQGQAKADEVLIDGEAQTVSLKGISGKLDPVPLTSCFARPVAESLVKYRFGGKTEVKLDGLIGIKDPTLNTFKIQFTVPGGTATYPLWEVDRIITDPRGTFTIKGSRLDYDVKGLLHDKPMSARGDVLLGKNGGAFSCDLKAGEFRHLVLGKNLPFEDLRAVITNKGGNMPFDISASVLGGSMTLIGTYDTSGSKPENRGELRLNSMDFTRFAKMYAPGNESEGDITGHLTFSGEAGNWRDLKGKGVLIILNGNLYALPILGPLTPLLGAVLPGQIKGYNVAKEANCNFTVANGQIVTDDFEALTSVFRLVAKGSVDFIKDDIDFQAQARVKGLPGLFLRPVSELLSFKGTGPMAKPKWSPAIFNLGR